jgi:hypothetical protein
MKDNWKHLPELIHFANKEEVYIHFNVVWNPDHMSMRFMNYDELQEIEDYFQAQVFPTNTALEKSNKKVFKELTLTVTHWKVERKFTKLNNMDNYEKVAFTNVEHLRESTEFDTEMKELLLILLQQIQDNEPSIKTYLESVDVKKGDTSEQNTRERLFNYWRKVGDYKFTENFFKSASFIAVAVYGDKSKEAFQMKTTELQSHVALMKDQQAVLSDLIDDVDRKSILNQLQLIYSNDAADLITHINENY